MHGYAEAAGHATPVAPGLVEWLATAFGSGAIGLVVGGLIAGALHLIRGRANH